MSGTGEVEEDFAGELRAFRIRLGEIRRIEAKCEAGIGEVCRRLARAVTILAQADGLKALSAGLDIHADDVRETLYQGLVGAGMKTPEATRIVREEIDDRGLRGVLENVSTALTVLMGSQEAPGEQTAGTASDPTPPSPSTSATSTASEPPSA